MVYQQPEERHMTLELSQPRIIERDPYLVVGVYCTYEGDDEGPGWSGAYAGFDRRRHEITNRKDDTVLGFLYRPHKDNPAIPEDVRSCFIGVEVADLDHIPEGMTATRFSGGKYVVVECRGDAQEEAASGVGEAIAYLSTWMPEHGYQEGDACFACSHEDEVKPPYIEYVYIKLEKAR
jgi:predicted transcriptional regulator YdeE